MAAPASFAGVVENAGMVHQPLGDADPAALGAVFGRIPALSMTEADDLVVGEVFGRVARDAALPAMRAACGDWRPDVVLREPAELSSCVAATERGIPQVQTNIGLTSLDDRLLPLFEVSLEELGVSAADMHSAPRWTTVPPSFDVAAGTGTGPVTHARDRPLPATPPTAPLSDWGSGDADQPLVYASFGSVAAGIGLFPVFYGRVLEQLAEVPARVLLTLGEAGDPSALGPAPHNVHVQRWCPQHEVLPHAALVVSHGGFGTTHAALVAGVPQVVLPLFAFDQFLNADRVAAVGVGLALVDPASAERRAGDMIPRGPAAADGLAAAVRAALGNATIAECARGLAAEIDALPDVDDCAASLSASSR